MKKIISLATILFFVLLGTGCKRFVFGEIKIDEEHNPLVEKKLPRTGADLFEPPVVQEAGLSNPDPSGALQDWATCLVMFKEGHPHGGGKMHGNFVYAKAPWRQEQFAVVHNTPQGLRVEVNKESVMTYLEREQGKTGPNYIRLIGGRSKLWGLCFYFYDKAGKLLNDKIYEASSRYQLFFSISDQDAEGKPYEIMDQRYMGEGHKQVGSAYFRDKTTFEARRLATPQLFTYTYRDTWMSDDMADGARDFFNIKLLPPYGRLEYGKATEEDQDHVGLKGHLMFDSDDLDAMDWPVKRKDGRYYGRKTQLLPYFYLAVRVMKCDEGKKAVLPRESKPNLMKCAPAYAPDSRSNWQELIRFNLPIKVFTNAYDTDPTNTDPNEPYYYHLGLELGLSPEAAYLATKNTIIHGADGTGGSGYGAWFL